MTAVSFCFHLVIERLFISGGHAGKSNTYFYLRFQSRYRAASHFRDACVFHWINRNEVSISLSSGFSFQGRMTRRTARMTSCFNLVIERLLISGMRFDVGRGFPAMFQSRYRAASHFRSGWTDYKRDGILGFNLVIKRLLISGSPYSAFANDTPTSFQSRYRAASHFRYPGCPKPPGHLPYVSISLSSGFSFQGIDPGTLLITHGSRFNLVIERLLISGRC